MVAGTVLGVSIIIGVDSVHERNNAIGMMVPGETAYIQTRVDMIVGGFLQQDVYTEIYVDPEGHVHTRLVTPGFGGPPDG